MSNKTNREKLFAKQHIKTKTHTDGCHITITFYLENNTLLISMDAGADQISISSTIATALCYIGSWQGIKHTTFLYSS